jgi:hypothetical protein
VEVGVKCVVKTAKDKKPSIVRRLGLRLKAKSQSKKAKS